MSNHSLKRGNIMKKIKKPLVPIVILVIVLSIFSWYYFKIKIYSNKYSTGIIEADEIKIYSEVSGKITEIFKDENDNVKKDDALLKIDDTYYKLQLNQAEANVKAIEYKLQEAKAGSRNEQIEQAKNTANQIKALLEGAEKNLEFAEKDLNRAEELYNNQLISQSQFEQAQNKYYAAKSQYDAYKSQYQAALNQVKLLEEGSTSYTIKNLEATLEQAKVSQELANLNLQKTRVISPVNGIINKKLVNIGELVNPGTPLFSIIDLNNLWIKIYVPEKDLSKIKLGQKVKIKADPFNDKEFEGEIVYISNKAEFTPKNIQVKEDRLNIVFEVKIKIYDNEKLLKPGMYAEVSLGG